MTPNSLLAAFLAIVAQWSPVFAQQRTWERAVQHALGTMVCLGRRCLSRIIWTNGGQHRSWSADYSFYSRSQWDPQQLFLPILCQALTYCPGRYVGMAADDTRVHKGRLNYGIRSRCRSSPPLRWLPTAHCFWPPCRPSERSEDRLLPSFPNGAAKQHGPPAWISSPYYGRKWWMILNCSNHST